MTTGNDERGKRASIDRSTGEVHGSGMGAGGGNPGEDYDSDIPGGSGSEPVNDAAANSRAKPREDKTQGTSG